MAMLGRTITEDCLMWASDYPHRDAVPYFPNTVGGVLANTYLSRAFKQKLLWENPARFYKGYVRSTCVFSRKASISINHKWL